MAATRLVSGVQREIWQEAVPQAGGPPQVVPTGIRASDPNRSRIRGLLTVTSIVGVPAISATLIIVDGFFHVRVFNANGGTSFTWMLDIERVHSLQQAIDPTQPNGVIQVVSGVLTTGGLATPQTLAQTYAIGADLGGVDQRMIVQTAKGGGLTIDCTDAGVTADGVSLEIRQSATRLMPTVINRRGDDALGPVVQFDKARGTYPIPADVLTTDLLGSCDFYGQSGGVPVHAVRIAAEAVMGGGFHATLDFKVKGPVTAVATALRIWNTGTAVRSIFSGVAEVIPAAYPNTSTLGIAIVPWSAAHIDTVNAYANVCVGGGAVGIAEQSIALLGAGSVLPALAGGPPVVGPVGSVFLQGFPYTLGGDVVLSLTQSASWSSASGVTPNALVPIIYNGQSCQVFAFISALA
jgi:hypothetical protein